MTLAGVLQQVGQAVTVALRLPQARAGWLHREARANGKLAAELAAAGLHEPAAALAGVAAMQLRRAAALTRRVHR